MVGDSLATAMGHGGKTPARPNTAQRPYRVRLASNVGAVRWWDHGDAAVVVENDAVQAMGRQW